MGVCFVVSTVYQGYSAISLAKDILKKNCSKIYILDCTPGGDFSKKRGGWLDNLEIISLSGFYSKSFYIRCILTRKIFLELRSGILKDIDKLYIYNDRDPFSLYFAKQINQSGGAVTLIEEGLSMYRQPISFFSSQMIKDQFKNFLFVLFSGSNLNFRFGFSYYVHEIMLGNPGEFKRRFPENDKTLITYNVDFSDEDLNRLFMSVYVDSYVDGVYPCVDLKVFMYFGQPLSELGLVCEADEMNLIKDVRSVAEKQGYKFILKSHPKDRKGKYAELDLGLDFFDSIVPVEVFMRFYGVDVVGSFSSSASYGLSASGGVKSLVFSKMLGIDYNFPKQNKLFEVNSIEHLNSVFSEFK